jgi:hypothetical protein
MDMAHTQERNVCLQRRSFHVFERDRQGYYTRQVHDPLGSVLSYLRDEHWRETHKAETDYSPARIYGLLDAIEICVLAYND